MFLHVWRSLFHIHSLDGSAIALIPWGRYCVSLTLTNLLLLLLLFYLFIYYYYYYYAYLIFFTFYYLSCWLRVNISIGCLYEAGRCRRHYAVCHGDQVTYLGQYFGQRGAVHLYRVRLDELTPDDAVSAEHDVRVRLIPRQSSGDVVTDDDERML